MEQKMHSPKRFSAAEYFTQLKTFVLDYRLDIKLSSVVNCLITLYLTMRDEDAFISKY